MRRAGVKEAAQDAFSSSTEGVLCICSHEAAATVDVRAAHHRVNGLLLVARRDARRVINMIPWANDTSVSVRAGAARGVMAVGLLAP